MPAYKDAERNTWYVKFQYKNWKDERKWVTKRGFKTKRDALQWEREFHLQQQGSIENVGQRSTAESVGEVLGVCQNSIV